MTDKQDKPIRKIALIDDDETCHMIFGVILKRLNPDIQVEAFSNALDAYRMITTNGFDASSIILDVNMPRMTGWQFLEELKVINYHIPVYMLTSSDDPRDRKRAEEFTNVRRYLIKPLRTDQLQEIINENLY